MDSAVARAMWQVLEPYHALTYFAPEARAATDDLGLKGGWMGYFAARAAPLGPVPAEVVIATFYNFHPDMVRRSIPEAWRLARPADVLRARVDAIDAALRRLFGDSADGHEIAEAAELARRATEACELAGRPLYAANAALEWPSEPHLVLWTATTRLREYRGDGHVASLIAARLDPCEAHVTIAATGATTGEMQRKYRWWSEDEWQAAVARLQARGWLHADGAFTDAGRAGREAVERGTDELAMRPWEHLGADGTTRLWDLMYRISRHLVDLGGIPVPNPMGLPWPPEPLDGIVGRR